MTPEESQDAAHLARALADTNSAWRREIDHAEKLKWIAVGAGAVGCLGLVFRHAVHESLVYILVGVMLAAVVAFVTSRECAARGRKAFNRSRRLHAAAESKGYPLGHDGRYQPVDSNQSDQRPLPYGYDPFDLN